MTNPDSELHLAELVAEIADDFRNRRKRGENPDPEEYATRHPLAARQIRDILGIICSAEPALGNQSLAMDALAAGTLGDFRLGREVGRGGMGVVYEALQISLGRRVALKVLPFAALVDARILKRFQNEARAAAVLDHPHVVKVHAVGQERGVHFIAMQFIEGRPLSDLIRAIHPVGQNSDLSKTMPIVPKIGDQDVAPSTGPVAQLSTLPTVHTAEFFQWVAELGAQAADALEHAHSLGVVHRDVKPSNLLFDGQGSLWVSDFGLAKVASLDAGVTMTGDVFGTLRYMSPEQALAKHDLVDHRTDIYSLGATLYELLAGRPVVEGSDKAEILRNVTEAEPVALRRVIRSLPKDLETVIDKCLRKEATERYASAKELAEDFCRFQGNEPVKARPIGQFGHARRWITRRPWLVGLASVAVLSVAAVVCVGLWAAYQGAALDASREKQERAELEKRAAESARLAAEEQSKRDRFHALLEQVGQRRAEPYLGWSIENMNVLRELAAMQPARGRLHDLRTEVAAALSAADLVKVGTLGPNLSAFAIDYSSDGKWLAVGRWGALSVRLYNRATGMADHTFSIPAGSSGWSSRAGIADRVQSVKFSPDCRWLLVGTASGRLASWDMSDLSIDAHVWPAHTEPKNTDENKIFTVVFSADGNSFLSGTRNSIKRWSLDGRPSGPEIKGYWLPWSLPPVGDQVPVSREIEGDIQLLDLASGQIVPETRYTGYTPLAVGPGGRLMASGPLPSGGTPRLQLAAPGSTALPLGMGNGGPVTLSNLEHLTFDPDGGLLVSVQEHVRQIKLWDAAASKLLMGLLAAGESVRAAFAPDGRQVAVCGRHGVTLYDVQNRALDTVGLIPEARVAAVAATPDHKALTIIGVEGIARSRLYSWRMDRDATYRATGEQQIGPGAAQSIGACTADGQVVAYATVHGERAYLHVTDGRRSSGSGFDDVRFGPDGRVWYVDAHSLRLLSEKQGSDPVIWRNDPTAVATGMTLRTIAVGRTHVFVGRRDGCVFRVEPDTGKSTRWPLLKTPIASLTLSPDESRLLVGGEGSEVRIVDLTTGEATEIPNAHRETVPGVAFGKHFFVTGSADRRVRLWALDGKPIVTFRMSGPVRKVFLSHDERSLLVLVEGERAVRRWRLDLLFEEWRKLGLGDDLPAL